MKKNDLEKKYFASKEELDSIRHNETLLKWEVLSKANKLGKEIWGHKFTTAKLAEDMDLPYTTTKRCLSLDNATPKSWELLRTKKISAFKLAMICQLKSQLFQDETVAVVIKDNMSTYNLKAFNPRSIEDINKWRHKLAVKKGYSREDSAFRNINNWIERGKIFMLMDITTVGPKNKSKVIEQLKILQLKIKRYLDRHG